MGIRESAAPIFPGFLIKNGSTNRQERESCLVRTRDVEISVKLSDFVAEFAGSREVFLFGNGKSLDATMARKALDTAIGKNIGYHAFRRFYISWCRAKAMPEDILKRLVGHSTGADVTSRYNSYGAQSTDRREWVEKIGLGFQLPNL